MTTEVQDQDANQGTYKGSYRKDVYEEEALQDATLEEQETEKQELEGVDEETINLKPRKEEHDYKKRYDDLKKHYDTKLSEWKQERETFSLESEMDQSFEEASIPDDSDTDIEQFKQEYPEVYNVVETISTKKTSKELEELKAEVNRLNEREKQLEAKGAYQQLLALHPDFAEIKKSEDFLSWLEDQPPSISNGIVDNSSDVQYASRVLDLYKADKGLNKKRGRPKRSAAEAVTRTNAKTVSVNQDANKKTWTTSEIRKLKPHEFDKLEAEIDLANAEGRIVTQ
jgi:hypothetical protein